MTERILTIVLLLPIVFIITALLVNEAKPKKNIILGVTLPYSAREDARVLEICARYRRRQWLCCAGLALSLGLSCLLPRLSIQAGVCMLWLCLAVAAPLLIFARANCCLAALKRAAGWQTPYAGTLTLDLGGAPGALGKPLSRWLFVPAALIPLALCLLSLGLEDGSTRLACVILFGSFALCAGLSIPIYPLVLRQRRDVVDGDSARNAALTRVRRYNWGKVWMATSYLSAAFALALWFFRENVFWFMSSGVVYSFALLALCLQAEFSARRAQERLTAAAGREGFVDEDDWWLWGLLYCNPGDRHLFINDRVGVGMSLNVGRPLGKAIMGLLLLSILALPALGGWFIAMDCAPRRAVLEDGVLSYTHMSERYSLPLDEVAGLALLETLPPAARIMGMGLDTLLEGRFSIEGYENCRISLNPREAPFIAVLTEDGETRIFNLMSPEETEAKYMEIRSELLCLESST